MICAWLMLGAAPCLAAATVESHHQSHDDHDCPHCETVVVKAASCELSADATLSPQNDRDPLPAVLPASYPAVSDVVPRVINPPSLDTHPPERSRLHRFCRLLE
ncbi:MAG TPA: hypothetical protein VF275_02670 [Gammaproteobacteria bacterium]